MQFELIHKYQELIHKYQFKHLLSLHQNRKIYLA